MWAVFYEHARVSRPYPNKASAFRDAIKAVSPTARRRSWMTVTKSAKSEKTIPDRNEFRN